MIDNRSSERQGKIIAVLSGKGGSGKTMIVAVMANILSERKQTVIIVDADTGTAGMTYYLGLRLVSNIRVGLSNVARHFMSKGENFLVTPFLQSVRDSQGVMFFGIGDHRQLEKEAPESEMPSILKRVLLGLGNGDWLIVDCRGGIDKESLAVCATADDILLISETDTTSFQATKHVVDVLSDNDLAHKLRGFIINKVFDDPSVLINQGTSVYGTQFLSAIPFDLNATRSFLLGEIPTWHTAFGRHVAAALSRAYPSTVPEPPGVWAPEDFREVGLTNLDSIRGGMFLALLILTLGILLLSRFFTTGGFRDVMLSSGIIYYVFALLMLGLFGAVEGTRRAIGRIISSYIRLLSRIFLK